MTNPPPWEEDLKYLFLRFAYLWWLQARGNDPTPLEHFIRLAVRTRRLRELDNEAKDIIYSTDLPWSGREVKMKEIVVSSDDPASPNVIILTLYAGGRNKPRNTSELA